MESLLTSDKKALRAEVRRRKLQHTDNERAALSETICQQILDLPQWRTAQCILLYHPLPDEVDVRHLLQAAIAANKQVLLPKVVDNDLQLRHYDGPASLQLGAFGIMEPTGPIYSPTLYGNIELVVVPGMAFDREGNRLGRGRGYYDRLLPRLPQAYLLGVGFPYQTFPKIPAEEHDVRMHSIANAIESGEVGPKDNLGT